MDILRNWIIGITAASLLIAASVALAPDGGVKRVVRLCGGLVLFITVVTPLSGIDSLQMNYFIGQHRADYEQYEEALINENSVMVKEIIQDRTRTYILQKAIGLGMECEVEVSMAMPDGGGYPYPDGVTVVVLSDPNGSYDKLSDVIAAELGIDAAAQKWSRP